MDDLENLKSQLLDSERIIKEQAAELEEKTKELERLSVTDRLTGLFSRVRLDDILQHEKSRFERYQHPFAVVLLNIDHFKQVNDKHGHDIGDQVLVEIADILRDFSRNVDAVCRWSGEEFLIVLPESEQDGAYLMAENLREKIEDHDFSAGSKITASFGVDVFTQGDEINDLLKRVETALGNAKENGRNRVETYS